jgi:single-stranded-DNA-specific exonuclease
LIYDHWEERAASSERRAEIHPVIGEILSRRGVVSDDDYRRFVAPSIDDLHDPAGIHGIAEACERIERAVRDHETILIYGDYDVDGVTSIVLLQTVLRTLGADAAHVVPHRLVDGYGLKLEVLERVLVERDVKLVITVDCGITSIEPVERAIERGIDVIITDHHLPPGVLPAAAAVLNPKQPGCEYPFKELAGVGVAFKLCCELIRRNGKKKISVESLLKIAAIGTVADVAPLIGENRTIAWLGLNGLSDPRNRGLRALIRRLGMLGRPLRAVDIGFRIGPRINAAGRLASADTAIDLFACTDDDEAWQMCAELDRLNAERQAIELKVREEAEKQVGGERVFVLAGENWHRGVIGLAAGRLAQKYHRPALVISIEGDQAAGSARSITTINLHAQLERVSDLFTHFGGHEFACGFSMPAANIDELRRRLAAQFAEIDDDCFRRVANVEAALAFADIDQEFVNGHEMLQPFGAANPQPMFVTRRVRISRRREFATDCVEMVLHDGTADATAVLWPSASALRDIVNGHTVDLLYQIEPATQSGSGAARLTIIDARNSTEA